MKSSAWALVIWGWDLQKGLDPHFHRGDESDPEYPREPLQKVVSRKTVIDQVPLGAPFRQGRLDRQNIGLSGFREATPKSGGGFKLPTESLLRGPQGLGGFLKHLPSHIRVPEAGTQSLGQCPTSAQGPPGNRNYGQRIILSMLHPVVLILPIPLTGD